MSVRRRFWVRPGPLLLATVLLGTRASAFAGAAPAPTFYEARVQPILTQACVSCHGPDKTRGGLQLHTFASVSQGGANGAILPSGTAQESELLRRLQLPADDEEAMPPPGKTRLSATDTEILRRWIQAGAPGPDDRATVDVSDLESTGPVAPAPDYRPFVAQLVELENALPVRFVPVSEKPTDGLVLRTVSTASEVDDRVLARLVPIARLVVDAELARTRVTDDGLAALSHFINLRRLDLSHVRVTSRGVAHLAELKHLETLNLVGTATHDDAWESLRRMPALRRIHTYGTGMSR